MKQKLDFTPGQLKRALKKGCLGRKERLQLAELLQHSVDMDAMLEAIQRIRREKHSPIKNIWTAALLMGIEAGFTLATK